jgi:AraC-like DNA-binding protein
MILPKSTVPAPWLDFGGTVGHKTGMEPLDELRALIVRHAHPGARYTALPGVTVRARSNPTEPAHGVYEPAFVLVAQGVKCMLLADQVFEYGAGQYLIGSLALPVSGRVVKARPGAPFLVFGFTLQPAAIAALLLEAPVGEHSVAASLGMAVSDAGRDLLEGVVRLLRLLDRPTDIPVLRPMIEREILWRLLAGEQGSLVRQIGLADGRFSQIGHAISWIREHFAETLRIEDLAARAAMSTSSFHRHFKAATAMSPLRYQKQIRLQSARARLMCRPEDVAAVGFGVGYDSPSQFSREYARLFGMPPGRDAARLRKPSTSDVDLV